MRIAGAAWAALLRARVVDSELLNHIREPDAIAAFGARWGDKVMLQPDDVASPIVYTVPQPAHVKVNEILVRPTGQEP